MDRIFGWLRQGSPFFALSLLAGCASPPDTESPHFQIQELGEGVYAAIHTSGGSAICNAGIVDLGDETLVLDPFLTPEAARDLKRVAEDLTGNPVTTVVNTHYHNDHIRGNQVFDEGTRILATSWTRSAISDSEPQTIAWERENAPGLLAEEEATLMAASDQDSRRDAEMWVGYYRGMLESHGELRTVVPNTVVDTAMSLRGRDREVRLLPVGEAHTESDLVMLVPDAGVAFMGDVLFVGMHPYLADGSPDRWIAVLENSRALDATVFVPGHGDVASGEALQELASYIRTLRGVVREALAAGRTPGEVIAAGPPESVESWLFPRFYAANVGFLFQLEGPEPDAGTS